MNTPPLQVGGASLTDVITVAKNIVVNLGLIAQEYLQVNGSTNMAAISVPTIVKPSAGRVARVSITTAGSATGMIYDSVSLTTTTKPVWVIPETAASDGEPYEVNIAVNFGILVVPGTGQTVCVGFS